MECSGIAGAGDRDFGEIRSVATASASVVMCFSSSSADCKVNRATTLPEGTATIDEVVTASASVVMSFSPSYACCKVNRAFTLPEGTTTMNMAFTLPKGTTTKRV